MRMCRFRVASPSVNSVVAPTALAVVDIVTGPESVTETDGTWYAALDVARALFPSHLVPDYPDQFPLMWQGFQYVFSRAT